MIPLRSSLLFPLPFLLFACASTTGSFAPLAASHPAHPQAPEFPITDPSAFLRATAAEAAPGEPEVPATAVAVTGTHVCPMHPDVGSDEPGPCPQCGMKLVPRADAPATEEEHPDER